MSSLVDHLSGLKCCQPGSIDLIDCLLNRKEQSCDAGVHCFDLNLENGKIQLNKQPNQTESIVPATCRRSIVYRSLHLTSILHAIHELPRIHVLVKESAAVFSEFKNCICSIACRLQTHASVSNNFKNREM